MKSSLFTDVIAVAVKAYPPPSFSDEAAVSVWVGDLAAGLTTVVYDAILSDPVVKTGLQAEAPPTDAQIEDAYKQCCSKGLCAAGPGGTHPILDWLKTVNWAQLIQTILSIISIIPKTPAA